MEEWLMTAKKVVETSLEGTEDAIRTVEAADL